MLNQFTDILIAFCPAKHIIALLCDHSISESAHLIFCMYLPYVSPDSINDN